MSRHSFSLALARLLVFAVMPLIPNEAHSTSSGSSSWQEQVAGMSECSQDLGQLHMYLHHSRICSVESPAWKEKNKVLLNYIGPNCFWKLAKLGKTIKNEACRQSLVSHTAASLRNILRKQFQPELDSIFEKNPQGSTSQLEQKGFGTHLEWMAGWDFFEKTFKTDLRGAEGNQEDTRTLQKELLDLFKEKLVRALSQELKFESDFEPILKQYVELAKLLNIKEYPKVKALQSQTKVRFLSFILDGLLERARLPFELQRLTWELQGNPLGSEDLHTFFESFGQIVRAEPIKTLAGSMDHSGLNELVNQLGGAEGNLSQDLYSALLRRLARDRARRLQLQNQYPGLLSIPIDRLPLRRLEKNPLTHS
jgi:hypothetical protein